MNQLSEQDIHSALERRILLITVIDAIITGSYQPAPKKRLRRGAVQLAILNQLNLNKNNFLCVLINERMNAAGYPCGIVYGDQYYKNVQGLQ